MQPKFGECMNFTKTCSPNECKLLCMCCFSSAGSLWLCWHIISPLSKPHSLAQRSTWTIKKVNSVKTLLVKPLITVKLTFARWSPVPWVFAAQWYERLSKDQGQRVEPNPVSSCLLSKFSKFLPTPLVLACVLNSILILGHL